MQDGKGNTIADTYVPNTRTVNGKALSSNVTLDKTDIGLSNVANVLQYSVDNKPTPADIGAVPTTRTVNGYALNTDIIISASDVYGIYDSALAQVISIGKTASQNYAVGDYVTAKGELYVVISPIATGTTVSRQSLEVLKLKDVAQALSPNFASMETSSTASTNYAVGDYLVLNGILYEVTSAIASGETIASGTNVSAVTVTDITDSLDTRVSALETALSGLYSRLEAL